MEQSEPTQPLPDKMSIDYYDEYIHIQKKWFGTGTVILTVFMGFWFSGFVFLFILAGDEIFESIAAVTYILPVAFITISGLVFYTLAAYWLNKTDIFVSHDLMEVKIGPVPWRGNLRRETTSIRQFYIRKIVIKNKNGTSITYDVRFKDIDDSDHLLLRRLETYEGALFMERQIEKYLGINNIEVDGEANF